MVISISLKKRLKFVPEGQNGSAKSCLYLRPLTLDEEESFLDTIQETEGGKRTGDAKMINDAFRSHVIGWENIKDEEGKALAFPGDGIGDDYIAAFDLSLRAEAFSFLLNQAGMKAETDLEKSE